MNLKTRILWLWNALHILTLFIYYFFIKRLFIQYKNYLKNTKRLSRSVCTLIVKIIWALLVEYSSFTNISRGPILNRPRLHFHKRWQFACLHCSCKHRHTLFLCFQLDIPSVLKSQIIFCPKMKKVESCPNNVSSR